MILLYHTIGKISIEFQNKIYRYFADNGNLWTFSSPTGRKFGRTNNFIVTFVY